MNETHHRFGELIHRESDDLGEIRVYEKNGKRTLTFGNPVEQSCMTLATPWQLEHEYTQGMMIGLLLHGDIRKALVLGLGGGSLVRALRHARPKLSIDALDYRMAVIRIAQEWFELSQDAHLRLHCDDAERFMASHAENHDLIFTDLFIDRGAHEAQRNGEFLSACRERLTEDGILLINQWCKDHTENERNRLALHQAFGEQVLHLHIPGGNQIAICFNGHIPRINQKLLFTEAQKLGMKLGIPLQGLARNFWRQNAMALQKARFIVQT